MTTSMDEFRSLIDRFKNEAHDAAITDALEQVEEYDESLDLVEAPNPEAGRELMEQIALIRIQRDALDKADKQLSAAAKVLMGDHAGLRAGNEPLGKLSRTEVTRINTEAVRANFPPEQYPQLYSVTHQERLLLDTAFKKQVIADNSKAIES